MAEWLYWMTLHYTNVPNEVAGQCICIESKVKPEPNSLYMYTYLANTSDSDIAAKTDEARSFDNMIKIA